MARRLVKKGGGRLRVLRPSRLAQADRHRLVAHERLVVRGELRQVLRQPAADAAVAADDLAVPVDAQAVVDVALQVLQHPAEPDHVRLRLLPAVPEREKPLGRRHRRGRGAAAELAALRGEPAAALGLARVVEGTAQDAQVSAELRRHEHALLGIREALREPCRGDADVVGERGGDDGGHGHGRDDRRRRGRAAVGNVAAAVRARDHAVGDERLGQRAGTRAPRPGGLSLGQPVDGMSVGFRGHLPTL